MDENEVGSVSWIKKAEDADRIITTLSQYAPRVYIGDIRDVYANSVIIFDTNKFKESDEHNKRRMIREVTK